MRYLLLLLTVPVLFLYSCSSTKELSDESPEPDEPLLDINENVAEEFVRSELDDFERVLYDNRSYMTAHFSQIEQEIPEQFLKEMVQEEREVDEYAGFRVQVLSTREVAVADSTIDEFRAWSSQELPDYQIETYVVFRQPYYRVRAGNFKNRDNAIEFSRMLKNRYPDAWVVHDRIDPDNITEKKEASEDEDENSDQQNNQDSENDSGG